MGRAFVQIIQNSEKHRLMMIIDCRFILFPLIRQLGTIDPAVIVCSSSLNSI